MHSFLRNLLALFYLRFVDQSVIAAVAQSFCISRLLFVLTIRGELLSASSMIAIVAHTFGIMDSLSMWAVGVYSWQSGGLLNIFWVFRNRNPIVRVSFHLEYLGSFFIRVRFFFCFFLWWSLDQLLILRITLWVSFCLDSFLGEVGAKLFHEVIHFCCDIYRHFFLYLLLLDVLLLCNALIIFL